METGNYNELIKMKKSKRSEDKYEIDFLLTGVHKKRYPLFKPPLTSFTDPSFLWEKSEIPLLRRGGGELKKLDV